MSIIGSSLGLGLHKKQPVKQLLQSKQSSQRSPFDGDGNIITNNAIDVLFKDLGHHAGDDNSFSKKELTAAELDLDRQIRDLEDSPGILGKFREKKAEILKQQLELIQQLKQNFSHLSGLEGDTTTLDADDLIAAADTDGNATLITAEELAGTTTTETGETDETGETTETDEVTETEETEEVSETTDTEETEETPPPRTGPGIFSSEWRAMGFEERQFYSVDGKDDDLNVSESELDNKLDFLNQFLAEELAELNDPELSDEDRAVQEQNIANIQQRIDFLQGSADNFGAIDINGDGQLTIEEFAQYYNFDVTWTP